MSVGIGTLIAGRYRVEGELGRGGMGVVYEVAHVRTGERFALKALASPGGVDSSAAPRLEREARASARIRSEHVVRVSEADVAPDGRPFFVMELLRGRSLESHVTDRGAIEPEAAVALLGQIAHVLSAAHGIGLVHRDLKPENIFLHEREDGSTIAKVLDFGIAKFVTDDAAGGARDTRVTKTGAVVGTPYYMAPEQAHGDNDSVGITTDVWALGLVTMRILTGDHYWGEPSLAALMRMIAVDPMRRPSERWPDRQVLTPAVDAWFETACNRDRDKRFTSVAAQIEALATALGVRAPVSVGRALPPSLRPPRSHPPGVDARRTTPAPQTLRADADTVPASSPVRPSSPRAGFAVVAGHHVVEEQFVTAGFAAVLAGRVAVQVRKSVLTEEIIDRVDRICRLGITRTSGEVALIAVLEPGAPIGSSELRARQRRIAARLLGSPRKPYACMVYMGDDIGAILLRSASRLLSPGQSRFYVAGDLDDAARRVGKQIGIPAGEIRALIDYTRGLVPPAG